MAEKLDAAIERAVGEPDTREINAGLGRFQAFKELGDWHDYRANEIRGELDDPEHSSQYREVMEALADEHDECARHHRGERSKFDGVPPVEPPHAFMQCNSGPKCSKHKNLCRVRGCNATASDPVHAPAPQEEPMPETVQVSRKVLEQSEKAIKQLLTLAGGISDGHCEVCGGYRQYDLHGRAKSCPEMRCPTHHWNAALEAIREAAR